VSSTAHRAGAIVLDDLNWQRRPYSPERAYAQSKLANLLFTLELQRRLADAGSRVRAVAAHPGWSATGLQGHTGNRIKNGFMAVGNRVWATSAEEGARPILFAATADLPGGSYVGPGGRLELRGNPTLVGRTTAASDPEMARKLWTASAELTGTDFPADLPTRT
jgi:NAD(P)-dependent dehydrogenase (short-subunit alcohol dehydrogenase family)